MIKTFDGSLADRKNCRRISKGYYEMNRQCFLMPDNKWHRINNGKICFDHELKEWVFINQNQINGIVGFDGNKIIDGIFTPNLAKNVEIHFNEQKYGIALNDDIIPKDLFIECKSNGKYYLRSEVKLSNMIARKINATYSVGIDYRCNYRMKEFTDSYNKYNPIVPYKINGMVEQLPNTTFGVEVETYDGIIPERFCLQNGMIPVKDGSLRRGSYLPFEYASVVLSGQRGLNTIKEQCILLDKYCKKSIAESLHVHIGNITPTKEYATAMYILGQLIQDEVYSMFPEWFRTTGKFKPSGKNYCNPLQDIKFTSDVEKNFEFIHNYLTNNYNKSFRGFGEGHPADVAGKSKWNVHTRYTWLNLVPLIYSQGTVEFRCHSQTFSSDKIINWIFITSAICKFAEKYSSDLATNSIKSVSLDHIINDMYHGRLVDYLTKYIQYRKDLMIDFAKRYNDKIGTFDIREDHLDNFKYPIKSILR